MPQGRKECSGIRYEGDAASPNSVSRRALSSQGPRRVESELLACLKLETKMSPKTQEMDSCPGAWA